MVCPEVKMKKAIAGQAPAAIPRLANGSTGASRKRYRGTGLRSPAFLALRIGYRQVSLLQLKASFHKCVYQASRRPHLTRRSSGLRGHSIMFPAVLSARSRLTRR
jgi:hypothetical protein